MYFGYFSGVKERVCVFIGGNWFGNQLSDVEVKLCFRLQSTVINLAGTVARARARIHFSPHACLSAGLHREKKEEEKKKKAGSVVRFSSPA